MLNKLSLTLAVCAALLAGCGQSADKNANAPATAQSNEHPVYSFGTEAVYPPFQFLDEKGRVTGFEPDVLKAVAQEENFEVELKHYIRNKWAESLSRQEFDGWSSAFYSNADYSQAAYASKPFIDTVRIIVSMPDNEQTKNITEIGHLKGKKIAVSKYYGQKMIDLAASIAGSHDNVMVTDSFYLSARELFNNNVNGVLGASYVLGYYEQQANKNNIKTKAIEVPGEPKREVVFLVGKHHPELLEKINRGIDKIKANGKYQAIENKWFGQNTHR